MSVAICFTVENSVASIVLDSSETGNFIDKSMAAEVIEACDAIAIDEGVRAVVIHSSGGDFCVGGESISLLGSEFESHGVSRSLLGLRMPIVAALSGAVFDQGLELALAVDVRIAAPDTRFAMLQAMNGDFPFDGGTQLLPRIAGLGLASEMLLTGRELSADEAVKAGLVSEIVENPLARASEIATSIVARGKLASAYTKEAVRAALDLSFEQGTRLEADLSFLLHGTSEREEGLAAFRERRNPQMPGAPTRD